MKKIRKEYSTYFATQEIYKINYNYIEIRNLKIKFKR